MSDKRAELPHRARVRPDRDLRGRLAHYKCPDAIEFGQLPKTSTGKTQKFVLRAREWAEADKRIGGV